MAREGTRHQFDVMTTYSRPS